MDEPGEEKSGGAFELEVGTPPMSSLSNTKRNLSGCENVNKEALRLEKSPTEKPNSKALENETFNAPFEPQNEL